MKKNKAHSLARYMRDASLCMLLFTIFSCVEHSEELMGFFLVNSLIFLSASGISNGNSEDK